MTGSQKKPLGILILAWIFISLGSLDLLGAMLMAVRGEVLFALTALIGGAITLGLGLALRTFRRWVYIVMLAYLGLVTIAGLGSGRIFVALVACVILLYLWAVNDAFEAPDSGEGLSILQPAEKPNPLPSGDAGMNAVSVSQPPINQLVRRFCSNCGSLFKQEAKFCSACGRPG